MFDVTSTLSQIFLARYCISTKFLLINNINFYNFITFSPTKLHMSNTILPDILTE